MGARWLFSTPWDPQILWEKKTSLSWPVLSIASVNWPQKWFHSRYVPLNFVIVSLGSLAALLVPCVCLTPWFLLRVESCWSFSSSSLWYRNFLSISSFSNSSCSCLAQNGVVNEHVGWDFFLGTWHTGSFSARFWWHCSLKKIHV